MIERKLTTREAGELLRLRYDAALLLLKATRVSHVRCGSAYLWDADAVECLANTMRAGTAAEEGEGLPNVRRETQGQGGMA